MTRNETPPDQKGGSGQWLKSNLSALGSATVFAVYAAGFIRTKAAAASLAEEPVRRVQTATLAPPTPTATVSQPPQAAASTPAVSESKARPASPEPVAKVASAATASTPSTPSTSATPPTPSTSAKAAPAPAKTVAATEPSVPALPAAKVPGASVAESVAPPTMSAPVAAPLTTTPATTPIPAPAPASSPAPAPTSAPAVPAAPTAAAPATSAAATAPARVGFKDGTFVGYGRSGHGDIEATVDIVDGQIVDAYITKCLTEYSCSWIVALPPQVAQRQSAEVDIVSGATASSNAFYAAIRQALSKAK